MRRSFSLRIIAVSLLFLLCFSAFAISNYFSTIEAAGTTNTLPIGTLINAIYNLTTSSINYTTLANWGPNTSLDLNQAGMYCDSLATAVQTGSMTITQATAYVDNSQSYESIILWYTVYGMKLGLPYNQTSIEWALDNTPEMANGLPQSSGTPGYFCVYQGYLLYVYYWANYYNYDLSKWNINTAYANFKAASYKGTYGYSGVLEISSSNAPINSGPRYYDEWGETARCFLEFYQMGIADGLNQAELAWNYWNTVDWNSGGYYQYRPNWNDFECEAPFFYQDVLMIQNYANSTLSNVNRLVQDTETRYLASGWTSPQWMYAGSQTVDHTVVHAHASNSEHRMSNTLGAWIALYGEWANLTSADQSMIRTMILGNGTGNYAYPAWQYLYMSSLYNPATNTFLTANDEGSGDYLGDLTATSQAIEMMMLFGIVPQTATLARPLADWSYESCDSAFDPQMLSIDFNLNQLTVGIGSAGIVTFDYGSTPFNYTFASSGVYTLQFSSDWNSITGFSISNFPSISRLYFVQPTNSSPSPTPTPPPSPTPTPTATPSPTPTPTPSPLPTLSPTPTATPKPTPTPSPSPTPTPASFVATIHVVNRNRNVANALVTLTLNTNTYQGYTNSLGTVQFTLTTNGNYAIKIYLNNVLQYSGTVAVKPPYSYTININ